MTLFGLLEHNKILFFVQSMLMYDTLNFESCCIFLPGYVRPITERSFVSLVLGTKGKSRERFYLMTSE